MAADPGLTTEAIGRISVVEGEVFLNGVPAKVGQSVTRGSVVETHWGKATVLLGHDSVIHLDRDSRFRFSEYSQNVGGNEVAALDLSHGATRTLVKSGGKKRFRIRSRAATLGVRGTEVYINSPKDYSKPQTFATLEGVADLYLPTKRPTDRKSLQQLTDVTLNDPQQYRRMELPKDTVIVENVDAPVQEVRPQVVTPAAILDIRGDTGPKVEVIQTNQDIRNTQDDKIKRAQQILSNIEEATGDLKPVDPSLNGGVLVETKSKISNLGKFDPGT